MACLTFNNKQQILIIASLLNFKHFTGFIVVAACVMTFEARDSAAKVVPARFKLSTGRNPTASSSSGSKKRGVSGSRRIAGLIILSFSFRSKISFSSLFLNSAFTLQSIVLSRLILRVLVNNASVF